MGYSIVAGGSPDKIEFSRQELQCSAMAEHNRWLSTRWINGWEYSSKRNDDEKQHPDIVNWAELPEDRREIDREMVREIPQYVDLLDKNIQQNVYIYLAIDSALAIDSNTLEDELEKYIQLLSNRYPNSQKVIVSYLSSELELKAICHFLRHSRTGLISLLTEPVYETAKKLSPQQSAIFTELLSKSIWLFNCSSKPSPKELLKALLQPERNLRILKIGETLPSNNPSDYPIDTITAEKSLQFG